MRPEGTRRVATDRIAGHRCAATNRRHRAARHGGLRRSSASPSPSTLSAGGFQDPTSESAQATKLLVDKFGQGDMELLISVTVRGRRAERRRPRGRHRHRRRSCRRRRTWREVTSAWTAPPPAAPALISKDGKTGLIVAGITGGESGAQKHAKELTDRLVHDRDGVTVRVGRRGDDLRPDQRAERKRPADDGVHRDPAELRGAGLGVRRPAGRGAAAGRRCASRSWARWRCCGPSPSSPTCRSSRST